MKKVMMIAIMVATAGVAFSQSHANYKARNHKLNKHQKHAQAYVYQTAALASDQIGERVGDYMERNAKFHHKSRQDAYVIMNAAIDYNYRALNRKLSKGNSHKRAKGNGTKVALNGN